MSNNHLKVVGNLKRGLAFVLSAPAGTGKTTLAQRLATEFDCVSLSISCTTRPPRAHEINGVHYHFLSDKEFDEKLQRGAFLEHVDLFGYRYGTSKEFIEKILEKGNHVLLVIDSQGALQLKETYPATFIFLMPPSMAELRRRLTDRKTEHPDQIEKRLAWAEREMATAQFYDYNIVNDTVDVAYEVLKSILIAEEHKVRLHN